MFRVTPMLGGAQGIGTVGSCCKGPGFISKASESVEVRSNNSFLEKGPSFQLLASAASSDDSCSSGSSISISFAPFLVVFLFFFAGVCVFFVFTRTFGFLLPMWDNQSCTCVVCEWYVQYQKLLFVL